MFQLRGKSSVNDAEDLGSNPSRAIVSLSPDLWNLAELHFVKGGCCKVLQLHINVVQDWGLNPELLHYCQLC